MIPFLLRNQTHCVYMYVGYPPAVKLRSTKTGKKIFLRFIFFLFFVCISQAVRPVGAVTHSHTIRGAGEGGTDAASTFL